MEPGKGEMKITDDQLLVVQSTIEHRIISIVGPFALKCAVDLRIPDRIHAYGGEPMPLPALALSIPVPLEKQPMLRRLMRLLSAQGVFAVQALGDSGVDDDGDGSIGYLLTPFSRLLVTADDGSPNMSAYVRACLEPDMVKPMYRMSEWLTQEGANMNAFETAHGGRNLWKVAQERPHMGRLFNEAMACKTRQTTAAAVACCPQVFRGIGSLVDVGGGTGMTAKMIAEAFPEVKCTVLELPHVVAAAPKSELIDAVAGDMFEYIPPAGAVLLKNVLHDWSDEDCAKILKQCKKAISANGGERGKVIIVDVVINTLGDDPQKNEMGLLSDILMMTGLGGKERDEVEWRKIFSKAGFANYKITPLNGDPHSIIELFP
ncbi:trans-resveratrol di-O-methyltransferase-like [Ananas comosus]|uniref:Trans-resveratrol di-O-methyltransferase-like n=1 Tax=Ananas comosus TaxID=4615 RepID=A0A6P5G2U9_ANACO|nr:trans-resveratrol di-O-methyltransferase-like [Ananas comosus]